MILPVNVEAILKEDLEDVTGLPVVMTGHAPVMSQAPACESRVDFLVGHLQVRKQTLFGLLALLDIAWVVKVVIDGCPVEDNLELHH